jgi:hypothetical protein
MNPHRTFVRKIGYLVAIVLLLPLLFWLGHPATSDIPAREGAPVKRRPGGVLSRFRDQHELSQARLGKIDPTSETIKLATFGMRGVAANILWTKANEYKMKKDWTNLSATLNQMVKVQPHFIGVWRFQAWNLSYNCSAEFDDYRQRYRWVIRGIEFLKKGIQYNNRSPRLLREVGRFLAQKLGTADEHKQFRLLFKQDDDFNGSRPKSERDNWLVGKLWYRKAENLADTLDAPDIGTSQLLFHSEAPMCQMNYSAALEKDGTFGEKARRAWVLAARNWSDYGKLPIPSSKGEKLRLGEYESVLDRITKLVAQLDALEPGLRKKIIEEKLGRLTDAQREAMAVPPAERDREQYEAAATAEALTQVSHGEVARRVARSKRSEALKLAEKVEQAEEYARRLASYRGIVNYGYWEMRAKVEQTDEMIRARKLVFEGTRALADGRLDEARNAFERGSVAWASVLRQFPALIFEKATTDDLADVVHNYAKTLHQRDELFPEDFTLAGFVRLQVDQDDDTPQARILVAEALEALANDDLKAAMKAYRRSLDRWQTVLNEYSSLWLMSDRKTAREVMQVIEDYAGILKRLDLPMPDNFPLSQFVWVQAEHAAETRAARQLIGQGDRAMLDDDAKAARKAYEAGLVAWRKVLDKFPGLIASTNTNAELMLVIRRYREVLKRLGEKMPDKFVLQDVLDRNKKK